METPKRKFLSSEKFVLDPTEYPHRKFSTRPTQVFVENVLRHIKLTGQPETFEGLYHGPIPFDTKYQILKMVDIQGSKRPNGDRAPCPMCTPNRFLHGALVWLNDLQVASVIGHCCAKHAYLAEREFKIAEQTGYDEDYLLTTLPTLSAKRDALKRLHRVADSALRTHKLFHEKCKKLREHLQRNIKGSGGRLRVIEFIRSKELYDENDYFGPSGFRGRGSTEVETRDHVLGTLKGAIALNKKYDPVAEVRDIERTLDSYEFLGNENDALDFIVTMTPQQRSAAVFVMQLIDSKYTRFVQQLLDFLSFFDVANVELLNRFGTHPHADFSFELYRDVWHGHDCVRYRKSGRDYFIPVELNPDEIDFRWEVSQLKRTR